MKDQRKQDELSELSVAILMAILWTRLVQNLLETGSADDGGWAAQRLRVAGRDPPEVAGIVTALRAAGRPACAGPYQHSLLPAIEALGETAQQLGLIFKEGRLDLIPATLGLLRVADQWLQSVAGAITYAINPKLMKGDGLTLAALFLSRFIALGQRRDT